MGDVESAELYGRIVCGVDSSEASLQSVRDVVTLAPAGSRLMVAESDTHLAVHAGMQAPRSSSSAGCARPTTAGSTENAVVEGIGRTGRLVTSAALILFLAFVVFALQPGTEAKIFATALGGGILIDATIIRGVLASAVVALLGRWNWWLPDWAARILRVEPSRLDEAPAQPAPQVG